MTQWQPLIAILVIAFTTSAGGIYIAKQRPEWYRPENLWRLIALSSGLMIGIAFLEFLPLGLAFKNSQLWIVTGIVFVLFMEAVVSPKLHFLEGSKCDHDHAHSHGEKKHPEMSHQHHIISHQAACSAVGCLIICCFFDGFGILSAFAVSSETGWVVSTGLFFHVLPDGVLAASIAIAGGMSQSRALKVALTTGGSLIIGASVSLLFGNWLGGQEILLPFTCGVLIYVTFIHLLPTGMKHPRGLLWMLLGLGFFVGFHVLTGHAH